MQLLGWLAVALMLSGCLPDSDGKSVIGETARIALTDASMEYLARIDTGA